MDDSPPSYDQLEPPPTYKEATNYYCHPPASIYPFRLLEEPIIEQGQLCTCVTHGKSRKVKNCVPKRKWYSKCVLAVVLGLVLGTILTVMVIYALEHGWLKETLSDYLKGEEKRRRVCASEPEYMNVQVTGKSQEEEEDVNK